MASCMHKSSVTSDHEQGVLDDIKKLDIINFSDRYGLSVSLHAKKKKKKKKKNMRYKPRVGLLMA